MICDDSDWKITQHAAVVTISLVSDMYNPYEKFFVSKIAKVAAMRNFKFESDKFVSYKRYS